MKLTASGPQNGPTAIVSASRPARAGEMPIRRAADPDRDEPDGAEGRGQHLERADVVPEQRRDRQRRGRAGPRGSSTPSG